MKSSQATRGNQAELLNRFGLAQLDDLHWLAGAKNRPYEALKLFSASHQASESRLS